jgi:hypothetical protein
MLELHACFLRVVLLWISSFHARTVLQPLLRYAQPLAGAMKQLWICFLSNEADPEFTDGMVGRRYQGPSSGGIRDLSASCLLVVLQSTIPIPFMIQIARGMIPVMTMQLLCPVHLNSGRLLLSLCSVSMVLKNEHSQVIYLTALDQYLQYLRSTFHLL